MLKDHLKLYQFRDGRWNSDFQSYQIVRKDQSAFEIARTRIHIRRTEAKATLGELQQVCVFSIMWLRTAKSCFCYDMDNYGKLVYSTEICTTEICTIKLLCDVGREYLEYMTMRTHKGNIYFLLFWSGI